MVLVMERENWGERRFQVTANLPKKGCAHLKLKDTCFMPDSHPSLISVSRLDDAKCYTLFGNGNVSPLKNMTLVNSCETLWQRRMSCFTATKQSDCLYHLDVPGSFTDTSYNTTTSPKPTKLAIPPWKCWDILAITISKARFKKGNVLGIHLYYKGVVWGSRHLHSMCTRQEQVHFIPTQGEQLS